jgi:hypothetical protein
MMVAVARRSSRERLFQGNQDPLFLTKECNVGHTGLGPINPRPVLLNLKPGGPSEVFFFYKQLNKFNAVLLRIRDVYPR